MTAPPAPVRFERILVALDESEDHQRVLKSAAEVAARLKAELSGLFVEDVNLLRLAELPCAREVHHTGRGTTPHTADIRREMKVHADAARRSLARAAERHSLRWSFRVTQGHVASELITAAGATDMMVVGRTRLAYHRRLHVGTTVRRVAAQAPAAVLIPGRGEVDGPIVVAFDGTPATNRALAAAARLSVDGTAIVLVTGRGDKAPTASDQTAIERAFDGDHRVTVRSCRLEALAGTVNANAPSFFIYGCDCGPDLTQPVQQLLDAIAAPILLIRGT